MATKRDVAAIWAEKEEVTDTEALRRIESFVGTIKEMLIAGDEIVIANFMRTRVDVVKPRTIRNLFGKGKDVDVGERRRLIFKPTRTFKLDIEREAI